MSDRFVIIAIDMETLEAWDAHSYAEAKYHDAREKLEELRRARGPWKEDPVVHGLVRRAIQ